MNSLVLIPRRTGVRYAWVEAGAQQAPRRTGASDGLRGTAATVGELGAVLASRPGDRPIDVLTIRATYGGLAFPASVVVDAAAQARLRGLAAEAPLAVANTNGLIDEARAAFPEIPLALAFETSFFVGLPGRETTYALPGGGPPQARRWGYHGLFHDAATSELLRALGPLGRPPRMLSICLDPRPEMAAVLGRTPAVVTGGSSEVEGLPGETHCGELDPAIALALAADPQLGPEGANLLLTRASGFCGMLGYRATLAHVLTDKRARVARVREHLLYHMTLAAGAALAALEGLDGVVFSGRYAEHGDTVAAHLLPQIERTLDRAPGSLPWRICTAPLASIVAEAGVGALLARKHGGETCGLGRDGDIGL
jgi:acetate kinase